jgi:hypothetical protein
MIHNRFRASPADHPWPSMADPRTVENCVNGPMRGSRRGAVAGSPAGPLQLTSDEYRMIAQGH